ncbi:sugar kinase [Salinibacterium sp. TMP30]|uniref:sugar kinase n=1 Tax=Salinibacterium sp. TMP30 TaxID=3138237 RepID=UPI00313914ED
MTEVVCIGETMGQFVPAESGFRSATSFLLNHAGAESNTAIALTRLGFDVEWVSRLGIDVIGDRILDSLRSEGVGVSGVSRDAGLHTGIFLKDPSQSDRQVTYYRTNSAASQISLLDIDRALDMRPRLIHLTGITPALSISCDQAVTYAIEQCQRRGILSSFDVNYRPQLWSNQPLAARRLAELASASDIVFIGQDEANELWGARVPADITAVIGDTATLIVKDGARQAVSISANQMVAVPALRVRVIESVGAGDSFAAGWLAGLLRGYPPAMCLRLGHLAARQALESITDQGEAASFEFILDEAQKEPNWANHNTADEEHH